MRKSKYLSGILAILLFSAFFNVHSQSLDEVQSKIEKINEKMAQSMINGDYTGDPDMYLEDAWSLPSYSPMLKGIEEIKKSNQEMAGSPMKITSFEVMIEKLIPAGNLYIEVGKYKMSMKMEESPEPMKDKGKYITIWEKQNNGKLKIKVNTWNSDMNPWQ